MSNDPEWDAIELAITRQDALKSPLQDRLIGGLGFAGSASWRSKAVQALVCGLRLAAVSPDHKTAVFCSWVALRRAWAEVGLPAADFEKLVAESGYEWPTDGVGSEDELRERNEAAAGASAGDHVV
jgi:hypothetical protein